VRRNKIISVFLLCLFIAKITNSFAGPEIFNLTLSAKYNSDSTSKDRDFDIAIEHLSLSKKISNDFSYSYNSDYSLSNGIISKTKEEIDFEQISKYQQHNNRVVGFYIRHRDDRLTNSEDKNYNILTIGYGKEFNKLSGDIFAGVRQNQLESIAVFRPAITYKNSYKKFDYKFSTALLRGPSFKLWQNKLKINYPLSERLSFNLSSKHEKYHNNDIKENSHKNLLGITIKLGKNEK
jgi:hypothetical protein